MTSKPAIEEQPEQSPEQPMVIAPNGGTHVGPYARSDAPRPTAAPAPKRGEVVLTIADGGDVFNTGRDDHPEVVRTGTAVPRGVADDLVNLAAANNVTIVKQEN